MCVCIMRVHKALILFTTHATQEASSAMPTVSKSARKIGGRSSTRIPPVPPPPPLSLSRCDDRQYQLDRSHPFAEDLREEVGLGEVGQQTDTDEDSGRSPKEFGGGLGCSADMG